MGIESLQFVVPEQWDASWFRRVFVAEILSKLDTRNAVGTGVTITSNGNSVATIDADVELADITAAIDAHEAEANPHPVYLTETEADALYADIAHVHTGADITTLIIENRTDDPVTPETGRIWLRTDL